jgi:hypothetical protein
MKSLLFNVVWPLIGVALILVINKVCSIKYPELKQEKKNENSYYYAGWAQGFLIGCVTAIWISCWSNILGIILGGW